MSALHPLEQFRAVFEPAVTADLKPGAEAYIGRELGWYLGWIIEEGYGQSQYLGEWACVVATHETTPFTWVPESDLRILE